MGFILKNFMVWEKDGRNTKMMQSSGLGGDFIFPAAPV